mgnify:FL=1
MAWLGRKIFKTGGWPGLFVLSGIVLLAVGVVTENGDNYYRPEFLLHKTVVIDPGHGGIDSGAASDLGDFEKNLTLQIGKRVADKLRAAGAQPILTREDDVDFYTRGKGGKRNDLDKRLAIAQENGAEIFVSIHANAIKGRRWTGAQVFYHPASGEGKELAACIQQHLREFPPGNRRKEKGEDYYLLRKNSIPAVIVEVGFLSNAEEAARLKDEGYQDRLAEEIYRGLVHYATVKQGQW